MPQNPLSPVLEITIMKPMVAISIENRRQFMGCLLTTGTFDGFRISEAVVRTSAAFSVDTHLTEGFYSPEELESMHLREHDPLPFSMMRQTLYELIRGTHTPLFFRFVLMLSPAEAADLLQKADNGLTENDIGGFFLNLTFQNGEIRATTAISYRSFPSDHSADRIWDLTVKQLLEKNGIIFEEIS